MRETISGAKGSRTMLRSDGLTAIPAADLATCHPKIVSQAQIADLLVVDALSTEHFFQGTRFMTKLAVIKL